MKYFLPFILVLLAHAAFAFQDSTARMPPEETRPASYWWWVLGVAISIGLGMLVYMLIKKDPRRDA